MMSGYTCTGCQTPQSAQQKALPPTLRRTSPSLSSCPPQDSETGSLTILEEGRLASRGHCQKAKEEATVPADPDMAATGGPTVLSEKLLK